MPLKGKQQKYSIKWIYQLYSIDAMLSGFQNNGKWTRAYIEPILAHTFLTFIWYDLEEGIKRMKLNINLSVLHSH